MTKDLVKKQETGLTTTDNGGIGISGLENVPVSDLPLPFYKFVGPMTKPEDRILADGSDCPNNVFLNNATKEFYKELKLRVLALAHREAPNFNDETKMDQVYALVGVNEDTQEIFMMSLRSTALFDFRNQVLPQLVKTGKATGGIYNLLIVAEAKSRTATLPNGKSVTYSYAGFRTDTAEITKEYRKELEAMQASWKDYLLKKDGLEESETIAKAEAKGKEKVSDTLDDIEVNFDDLPA